MKLLIFLSLIASNVSFSTTLELSPGERKKIPIEYAKKVAILHPEIADIDMEGNKNQATITGVSVGRTTLEIVDKSGTRKSVAILVVPASIQANKDAQEVIAEIEGVESHASGENTIIEGNIYRVEDYQKIKNLSRKYRQIKNQSRFHPKVLEYFSKQIKEELSGNGFSDLQVLLRANTILIKGEVQGKKDVESVERIVKNIFAEATFDVTNQLASETSTLIDIKFLEVRKSNASDIGVKWPASFYADGTFSIGNTGKSNSLVLGQQSPLTLNMLVEKGIVKILSNPKLLCKNGKTASFLAGGEIPIRLISERSASVSFKQYGINLEITARSDRSNNISLDIFAKISDIDASVSIEGLPGFIEHHVKTAADIKINETIVLAGLLENKNKKNVSKFPLLGHLPVLGELFKSRSFQNNESEFLVTLTPTDSSFVNGKQQLETLDKVSKKPISFSLLD